MTNPPKPPVDRTGPVGRGQGGGMEAPNRSKSAAVSARCRDSTDRRASPPARQADFRRPATAAQPHASAARHGTNPRPWTISTFRNVRNSAPNAQSRPWQPYVPCNANQHAGSSRWGRRIPGNNMEEHSSGRPLSSSSSTLSGATDETPSCLVDSRDSLQQMTKLAQDDQRLSKQEAENHAAIGQNMLKLLQSATESTNEAEKKALRYQYRIREYKQLEKDNADEVTRLQEYATKLEQEHGEKTEQVNAMEKRNVELSKTGEELKFRNAELEEANVSHQQELEQLKAEVEEDRQNFEDDRRTFEEQMNEATERIDELTASMEQKAEEHQTQLEMRDEKLAEVHNVFTNVFNGTARLAKERGMITAVTKNHLEFGTKMRQMVAMLDKHMKQLCQKYDDTVGELEKSLYHSRSMHEALLNLEDKSEGLLVEKDKAEVELKSARAELEGKAGIETKLENLEKANQGMQVELRKKTKEVNESNSIANHAFQAKRKADKAIVALQDEISETKAKLTRAVGKAEALEKKIEEMETPRKKQKKMVENLEMRVDDLEGQVDETNNELEDVKMNLEQAEKDKKDLDKKLKTEKTKRMNAEKRADAEKVKRTNAEQKVKAADEKRKAAEQERLEAVREKDNMAVEMEGVTRPFKRQEKKLEAKVDNLSKELKKIREDHDKKENERIALSKELDGVRKKYNAIKAERDEAFEMRDEAMAERDMAEKKMKELKQKPVSIDDEAGASWHRNKSRKQKSSIVRSGGSSRRTKNRTDMHRQLEPHDDNDDLFIDIAPDDDHF